MKPSPVPIQVAPAPAKNKQALLYNLAKATCKARPILVHTWLVRQPAQQGLCTKSQNATQLLHVLQTTNLRPRGLLFYFSDKPIEHEGQKRPHCPLTFKRLPSLPEWSPSPPTSSSMRQKKERRGREMASSLGASWNPSRSASYYISGA